MKKILLLCAALACVSPLFAEHPAGKIGIGGVVSSGFGDDGLGGTLGLSLKLPSMPVFWAARMEITPNVFGFGATGDVYIIDNPLIRDKNVTLDWFFGVGGYANIFFSKSSTLFSLGARVPVGLSWYIVPEWELFLDLAPSVGLTTEPLFPALGLSGELGLRYWVKK